MNDKVRDLVIIGAGPAALSAATYTCREDIDTLLLEKGIVGGQAATTDWIDNYPGFPDGVAGDELARLLRKQAERFGAVFDFAEVNSIERHKDTIVLATDRGKVRAKAALLATGTRHKLLGIPNEKAYTSRGVHYCATCDGAFYRGKSVIVVGGGNSAVQEAIFLTRFVSHVTLLVRSELKASDVLQQELSKQDKISVIKHVTPTEVLVEDDVVKGVKLVHTDTDSSENIYADGVFIFIGLLPNTNFLQSSEVELDKDNFVVANATDLQTSMPGVFVAGDVRSGATMQIASAVGEGATAALRIRNYLEEPKHDSLN